MYCQQCVNDYVGHHHRHVKVSTLIVGHVERWQNLSESLQKSFEEIRPNFKSIRLLLVYLEAVREAAHLPLGIESAVSVYDLLAEAAKEVPSLFARAQEASAA
jgi:hypothetical protein